jgi:hypothetical protein
VKVIVTIVQTKDGFQYENFKEIIIQMPITRNVILSRTTNRPPKYLPKRSCALEIGFERKRSILPFSRSTGIKLEALKIESSRPMLATGETIPSSIIITIFPDAMFLFEEKKEFRICDSSTNPKITPVIIRAKHESPKKKIKTFLAKDSLNV